MPVEGKTMPSMGYNCLDDDVTFYVREGDTVPDNGTCPIGGKTVKWPIREVFENKRVLVITLPGAFTPTCSTNQVPGFEEHYDAIKEAGKLDEIYIMAVNDSFVMNAWAEKMGIKKCRMLPDGNMSWTTRLYLDNGMYEAGMGARARRTALLFNNGTLIERWVEDMATEENPDPYYYSKPGKIMRYFGIETDLDSEPGPFKPSETDPTKVDTSSQG